MSTGRLTVRLRQWQSVRSNVVSEARLEVELIVSAVEQCIRNAPKVHATALDLLADLGWHEYQFKAAADVHAHR